MGLVLLTINAVVVGLCDYMIAHSTKVAPEGPRSFASHACTYTRAHALRLTFALSLARLLSLTCVCASMHCARAHSRTSCVRVLACLLPGPPRALPALACVRFLRALLLPCLPASRAPLPRCFAPARKSSLTRRPPTPCGSTAPPTMVWWRPPTQSHMFHSWTCRWVSRSLASSRSSACTRIHPAAATMSSHPSRTCRPTCLRVWTILRSRHSRAGR